MTSPVVIMAVPGERGPQHRAGAVTGAVKDPG
jgi:hypothetical protein